MRVVATTANGVEKINFDFSVVESDYGMKVNVVDFETFFSALKDLQDDECIGCEDLSSEESEKIDLEYGIGIY